MGFGVTVVVRKDLLLTISALQPITATLLSLSFISISAQIAAYHVNRAIHLL